MEWKTTARRISRLTVDFSAYAVVRLAVAVIQALPLDMGDRLCRSVAWLASGPLKVRERETSGNLSLVFPDATVDQRRHLNQAMWHSLLLMACEIAWAQRRLHRCNWGDRVSFRGNQDIIRALLSRRPTVMVTGHFGNFEIGGYLVGLMGFQTTTIARRLDNEFLHRWVERFRSARGQHLFDKEGCAPDVDRLLRAGGTLSLLADQHAGDKGCWVEFMGVPASCHKALALFSMSSGAPMVAVFTRRVDRRPMHFESGCVAVADPQNDPSGNCASVESLTRWYNQQLADTVRPSVEQYWWLHRRWRTPPPRVLKRLQKQQAKLAA